MLNRHPLSASHLSRQKSVHAISDKKAARYFDHRAIPQWVVIMLIISAPVFLISLPFRLFFITGISFIAILICTVRMYTILRANPTDEEYDIWLEQKAQELLERGRQRHNISEHYPAKSVLCIRSVVPPGTQSAKEYVNQHVRMKEGKDGQNRFSINVYTYFFPMKTGMAIFKSDMNVFNTSQHVDEQHEAYPYRDLSTATTVKSEDKVLFGNRTLSYQIEKLYLQFSNGTKICFSDVVKTKRLRNVQNAPFSVVANDVFDKELNVLRALLLSRGHSTHMVP